ncbi:putative CAAX prenyl protease 2 [Leucoagaricus sp. SymC.cos]|nr:putative CAAX prenyl protease 2 [Leucoagaricus sp. SymC.cos]
MLTFTAPQLTASTAHLLSFTFSAIYVGSIYVSARTRLSLTSRGTAATTSTASRPIPREKMKDERWRDDPDVIKARIVAVSIATTLNCLVVFSILWTLSSDSPSTIPQLLWDLLIRLGFVSNWKTILPHLLAPLLFLGPLYASWLAETLPWQKYWSWELNVKREVFTWIGIRNIIFAPPTEEIVFRACILSTLHVAGVPRAQLLFLSPLSFGLAHVHHAWDTFNRYGRTSQAAVRALLVTIFQMGYTSLFGWFTSFVFLRTSSIYAPISAHMFCNFMGFPRMSDEMERYPKHKKDILTAYVVGVTLFSSCLFPFTWTEGSFYWANYTKGRTWNVY